MGRTIGVVAADEAAIGVDAVVAAEDVAGAAVVGDGRAEVDRAMLAAVSFPLVHAWTRTIRDESTDLVDKGVVVAVRGVAQPGAAVLHVVAAVMFLAAITAKRVGVVGILRSVDVGETFGAVVAVP